MDEQRLLDAMPAPGVRWIGTRTAQGTCACQAQSPEVQQMLVEKGVDRIVYRNGEPDFTPVSHSMVRLPQGVTFLPENTPWREEPWKRQYDTATLVQQVVSGRLKVTREEAADLTLADMMNRKDGPRASCATFEQYRLMKDMVWHACFDGRTMVMIPRKMHAEFSHWHESGMYRPAEAPRMEPERGEPTRQDSPRNEPEWEENQHSAVRRTGMEKVLRVLWILLLVAVGLWLLSKVVGVAATYVRAISGFVNGEVNEDMLELAKPW